MNGEHASGNACLVSQMEKVTTENIRLYSKDSKDTTGNGAGSSNFVGKPPLRVAMT